MNTENIFKFESLQMNKQEAEVWFQELLSSGDLWNLPTEYLDIAATLMIGGVITNTATKKGLN